MKQSRDGEVICRGRVLVRDLCAAGSTAQAYPEIDNTPKSESSVRALEGLIEQILEPIRAHFGSLTITHGFTSLELVNRVPRGVARGLDQHCSHELNTRGSRICQRDGGAGEIRAQVPPVRSDVSLRSRLPSPCLTLTSGLKP